MRTNKQLLKLIENLNLEYTCRQSIQKEVDLRLFEVNRLREQVREREAKQNQLVMDISVLIMTMNQARNDQQQANNIMTEVFLEDNENEHGRTQLRATLNELSGIVSFVYCNDNTNRLTAEQLEQINRHLA